MSLTSFFRRQQFVRAHTHQNAARVKSQITKELVLRDPIRLQDLVRITYGDEIFGRMVQITVDSTSSYLMLTTQRSSEAYDSMSWLPAQVYPLCVWHYLAYIELDGETIKLHPLDTNIEQAHRARVNEDEVPLSWLRLEKPKRDTSRDRRDNPFGHDMNSQLPAPRDGERLLDADSAYQLGGEIRAAGELIYAWNKMITQWWASDERQTCIERADEWAAATAHAEPQEDYARTIANLRKLGLEPRTGDVVACPNMHRMLRIGVDGLDLEMIGDGVMRGVEIDASFSHELGALTGWETTPEQLAKARQLIRARLGLSADVQVLMCHSDYSGTLDEMIVKRQASS